MEGGHGDKKKKPSRQVKARETVKPELRARQRGPVTLLRVDRRVRIEGLRLEAKRTLRESTAAGPSRIHGRTVQVDWEPESTQDMETRNPPCQGQVRETETLHGRCRPWSTEVPP